MWINWMYFVHLQSPVSTQQMSWQLLSWCQFNTWVSFHEYITYSMDQSPSWEANQSLELVKKFPAFLWNPKVLYCTHKCPPPVMNILQVLIKHTSSYGKSAFFSIDWLNGTGMKMKSVIKNTHPVTTPKASGLKEIL
jgi:hypothetical protein